MLLLIGSYAAPGEQGIHVYQFNEATHRFELKDAISGIENPTYLAIPATGNILYAVSEYKTGDFGRLSTFIREAGTAKLTLTEQLTYAGTGSCFISVANPGTHAFIANYIAGSLVAVKLSDMDTMAVSQTLEFSGSGPDPERQEQSHIHAALISPDQQFLYCTDLGADRLYRFAYTPGADEPLSSLQPAYIQLPPGSGPRHLAFSPDRRWLFLITELSGEIFVFPAQGKLSAWVKQLSILAEGYSGKVEAADIQVHPNGKYLYASHRGDSNEIVVFRVDPGSGSLSLIQRISAEGISPRSLAVWGRGSLLMAANEQSGNVAVFTIGADGQLAYTGKQIEVNKPACLKIIEG